jgi:hypothetical protein
LWAFAERAYVAAMSRSAGNYRPRDAAHAALYRVIDEHLGAFLETIRRQADGVPLPAFVEQEFYDFLTCGILAHGFARLRCVVAYGTPPAVAGPCAEASGTSRSAPRHWAWAALMRRAFDLDVLACPRCGGRLRLIATVEDPEATRAILAALAASREREGRAPPGAAGEPPSPAGVLGA